MGYELEPDQDIGGPKLGPGRHFVNLVSAKGKRTSDPANDFEILTFKDADGAERAEFIKYNLEDSETPLKHYKDDGKVSYDNAWAIGAILKGMDAPYHKYWMLTAKERKELPRVVFVRADFQKLVGRRICLELEANGDFMRSKFFSLLQFPELAVEDPHAGMEEFFTNQPDPDEENGNDHTWGCDTPF